MDRPLGGWPEGHANRAHVADRVQVWQIRKLACRTKGLHVFIVVSKMSTLELTKW
jgi:hypothetical protein